MRIRFKAVFSYLMIIVGAVLASFSVACILLPNDAIDYGTAGIAIIISKMTGLRLSLAVIVVFLPFLLAGLLTLGRRFFAKALTGSIIYTVGIELFGELPFELNTEHFLAVVFGGALLGIGLSLILRAGGCIDGSEILANIIVRFLSDKTGKNYSMTFILISFNTLVYATAFLVIDRSLALMSLLVYVVATAVTDHFTDRFEAVKQVTIITSKPSALVSDIKQKLNKTCTIIESRGAIAGKNYTVICYVNYFELNGLREIISGHEGSFTTITTIDEIIR